MSKVLFFTDTHIGAAGGSDKFRALFREYYRDVLFPYIKENGIKQVFHLGDFFNSRTSLSVADIDYVVNEFIPGFKKTGAKMYMVAGNHDCFYKNTNRINSLALFEPHEEFVVVDNQVFDVDIGNDLKVVLVPWINEENHVILRNLSAYDKSKTILGGHFAFQGVKMYKTSMAAEEGLDPNLFQDWKRVLSGHYHHPSTYGVIDYIGATFHYNWLDYKDWRGFVTYDPETDTWDRVENKTCLFNRFSMKEAIEWDDDTFLNQIQGKIVRLVLDQPYEELDLRDLKAKIESAKPISLDIVDETIFETKELENAVEDVQFSATKDVVEYVEESVKDHPLKNEILSLFDLVRERAKMKMKEVE